MPDGSQTEGLHPVRVNMAELEAALDSSSPTLTWYLDVETGEVIPITEDMRSSFYEGEEAMGDEAFAVALDEGDLDEEVAELARIDAGLGTRYFEVPSVDSYEAYRDIEEFIETVQDDRQRSRLRRAIDGRGAFRRFRDALGEFPSERERWFVFKDERTHQPRAGVVGGRGLHTDRTRSSGTLTAEPVPMAPFALTPSRISDEGSWSLAAASTLLHGSWV